MTFREELATRPGKQLEIVFVQIWDASMKGKVCDLFSCKSDFCVRGLEVQWLVT